MAKKNKKKNKNAIHAPTLWFLLKRVYLGGKITECVLASDGRKAQVNAVDLTNSIFVSVSAYFTPVLPIDRVGISNLSVLTKFLNNIEGDVPIAVVENKMTFKQPGSTFKFLLSEPDAIPTSIDSDKDLIASFMEGCLYEIELSEALVKQVLYYTDLIASEHSELVMNEDGKVKLLGGRVNESQFSLVLGKASYKEDKTEEFEELRIPLYNEHLKAILSELYFSKDDEYPPTIYFASDAALVIMQDEENIWALQPVEG